MEKAYKFRIYPTSEQEMQIQRTFGCCRYVFNHFLARRKVAYEEHKETMSFAVCCRELTKLKQEHNWLIDVDATALQSALRALDTAYQGFFRRVKKGEKPGYPRFKSKRHNRKSYTAKNNSSTVAFDGYRIRLPKLGWVSAKGFSEIKGRILNATVSQSPSGKYFVSICCTGVDIEQAEHSGAAIGLDMGLKTLAVTSDGAVYPNHKHLSKSLKKLARLQRRLSRKPKGSKRREKARLQVARLHERVSGQRDDALHKLTTELVRDHDVICVEKLKVKNLLRNHRLARSISDASWGELKRQLAYKVAWHGKRLLEVDTFFPSSQLCSICGHQNAEVKNPAVREWACPECGAVHDRDVNAARNILREGLKQIA